MEEVTAIDQDSMVDDFAVDYLEDGNDDANTDDQPDENIPEEGEAQTAQEETAEEVKEEPAKDDINSFIKDDGSFDTNKFMNFVPEEAKQETAYNNVIQKKATEQSQEQEPVDPYRQQLEAQVKYEDNFKQNYFHGLNRVLELSQQYPNSNVADIAREVERELERDATDHFRKTGIEKQAEWQQQTEAKRKQEMDDFQSKGKFDMNLSSIMLDNKMNQSQLDDLLFKPEKGGKVAEMLFALARPEESKKSGNDYVESYMSWFTNFGSNKQNLKTLVDVSKSVHIANNLNNLTKAIREQEQTGKKQLKSASMQSPKTVTSLGQSKAVGEVKAYLDS